MLAASITSDSFDEIVRLQAHQLGIGADTIVGQVDDAGLLPDEGWRNKAGSTAGLSGGAG